MMLAEALNERAGAQRRLADLRQRVGQNARVLEGQRSAEDPQALLYQALEVSDRIRTLVVAVNLTNASTRMPDGATVTEAIARRDALGQQVRLITEAASRATDGDDLLSRRQGIALLDVSALRAEADRLATARFDLDVALQQVNWSTELAISP